MKKVVDTSALRSREVIEYLKSSISHEIIIPQLVLCECLQGDGVQNARRSLEGIACFGSQISVLKSDAVNFRINPRRKGLQSRLIDERLTQGLRANLSFNLGQSGFSYQLVNDMIRHDEFQAKAVLSAYSVIAGSIRSEMLKEHTEITEAELRMMRSHRVLPHCLLDRIEYRVMRTLARSLNGVGLNIERVSWLNALFSLPFRFSIAIEALAIDWAVLGGLDNRSDKNVANDLRDMSHVAYSTFYDGVIAFDQRMLRVENLARILVCAFERRYAGNIC